MADKKPSPLYDKPDVEEMQRARAVDELKQKMQTRKRVSPLYGKGKEEWQAQPSGRVDDENNAAGSPDNKGTSPSPDEAMHTLGQFKANVGRDMPIKWKAIKTVGVKV